MTRGISSPTSLGGYAAAESRFMQTPFPQDPLHPPVTRLAQSPLQKDGFFQEQLLTEELDRSFGIQGMRFIMHEQLGCGSFGSVYRCSLETPGTNGLESSSSGALQVSKMNYAVKIIDAKRLAMIVGRPVEHVLPKLRQEVDVHRRLGNHQNIVALHYHFYSEVSHKFYLVCECLNGGDLFQAIVNRPMKEKEARFVFTQLANAISFIHGRGVAHRDLKLENILLESAQSMIIKLCDYGQAKIIAGQHFDELDTAKTLTTAPAYTAPEVKSAVGREDSYNAYKADCYGMGVILYALLMNAFPNPHADKEEAFRRKTPISSDAKDLVTKLLTADPEKRLDITGVLEHPWVKAQMPGGDKQDRGSAAKSESDESTENDSPSHRSSIANRNAEALVKIQNLIIAMQRERGTSCWSLSSQDGWDSYVFMCERTEKSFDDVGVRVNDLARAGHPESDIWKKLTAFFECLREEIRKPREQARRFNCQRVQCGISDNEFRKCLDVQFRNYCSLVISLISETHELQERLFHHSGQNPSTIMLITHKLLQITAEQLGRERAFLIPHFERPQVLNDRSVSNSLAEMIGVRKFLLGSSRDEGSLPVVVSASKGLFPALQITEQSLLESDELQELEQAERCALSGINSRGGTRPAVGKTFHLLTQLIDKIHQRIIFQMVQHSHKPLERQLST